MSLPRGRFARSKARQRDSLRHQIPALCPHSPPPPPPTRFTLIGALGVNIDSVINFSNHIGELCRKTSQQIGVLIRLKHLLPARAKLQLFKPAILPHLTYCGTAWHFCRASNRPKVERLQDIALRIVINSKLGLKFFVYCICIVMWHSHYIIIYRFIQG